MTKEEITSRICGALDALDAHDQSRKDWLAEWKKEREILAADLRSFRTDAHTMRLDEVAE